MTLKKGLQLFGLLTVLFTLIPIAAADNWWIRIFDFPHAQLTGLTLMAIGTFLVKFDLRNWRDYAFITVLIACFVYQFVKIYPYTPLANVEIADSSSAAQDEIRVFTANVYQQNTAHDKVLTAIKNEAPHLILLMETNQKWYNAVHPTLSKTYPYFITEPLENTYGMLLYSSIPLEDTAIRYQVSDRIPSMKAMATLENGAQVQLLAIHPTPPMPQHKASSSDRDKEMMLTAFEAQNTDKPVIVLGDFNDVAWSSTTSLFRSVSRLLDPRVGRGFYNTFNANSWLMRWPLDHLFVSPHFRLKKIGAGTSIGSDHFPVIATLSFEPEAKEKQKPAPPTQDEIDRANAQLGDQSMQFTLE